MLGNKFELLKLLFQPKTNRNHILPFQWKI